MFNKIFAVWVVSLVFLSCATKKDVLYYQDITKRGQGAVKYVPNSIQINDILSITVSSLVPELAEPFNPSSAQGNRQLNTQVMRLSGYLVAQDGSILFPILGTIAVAGKTAVEVQELLSSMISEKGYIKDPVVNVRIINNKVTILGEVKNPGTFSFEEQNVSLIQALGYAGDLTINGVRKDVLLIREVDGVRTYVKLDLTSSQWFDSPYYFLRQNDIIIVNPNGAKIMSSGYLNNIGTTMGILSFALTVYLILLR
jgi:polysaccharide biosynthesis/export protein